MPVLALLLGVSSPAFGAGGQPPATPPAATEVTVGSGAVRFARAPASAERTPLGEMPSSLDKEAYAAWQRAAVARGALAAVDAAVGWRAGAVDTCMQAAGAAGPVEAVVRIGVAPSGAVRARPRSGDAALGACVVGAASGIVPVPLAQDPRADWTVRWAPDAGAAPAAPTVPAAGIEPAAPAAPSAVAEPGAAAATAASAGADPSAFVPSLDAVGGFATFDWGVRPDGFEALSLRTDERDTRFYARWADAGVRWLGAPTAGITYAFGSDGFYAATVGIVGKETAWRVREALTARYGEPRWDSRFGSYYWRGSRVLLQLRPVPGSDAAMITWMDIARGRASGLAESLPGDPPDARGPDAKRRLPRIFQDKTEAE